jgi:hypothetical protein
MEEKSLPPTSLPPTSLPPTTTVQQDLVVAAQRHISVIWEYTQAFIAIMLVGAFISIEVRIVFVEHAGQEVPTVLATLCGMVVGSYFQRTNHMNIGGVGAKTTDGEPYRGR